MKKTLIEIRSKLGATFVISALILLSGAPLVIPASAHAAEVINTWWPASGAHVTGMQPFKAMIPGLDVSQYDMFWQVDGGGWNWMGSNYTDYQHKEALVDVGSWNWRGSGPYVVTFIARKGGSTIATAPVTIYIDNGAPEQSSATPVAVPAAVIAPAPVQPAAAPTVAPAPVIIPTIAPTIVVAPVVQTVTQPAVSAPLAPAIVAPVTQPTVALATPLMTSPSLPGNPLSGTSLYVSQNSPAAAQAQAWQTSNPSGASMMRYLAAQPTAVWLGEWNANVAQDVRTLVTAANAAGTVPTFVAYAIPQRDCGGFSSGGTNNPSAYASWIGQIASGIGQGRAIVILEPDALAQITCLPSSDQATRLSLIRSAVTTLKQNPNTHVYIDAGHSGWIDQATMANRLSQANISAADGFALNVSNFMTTTDEMAYGTGLSQKTNNKHFVIDTARNGNGSDGNWCNPLGRSVGQRPTTGTGTPLVDAFLWLKVPGESDGSCNGGPSAGTWWPSYALQLVQNAHIAGL